MQVPVFGLQVCPDGHVAPAHLSAPQVPMHWLVVPRFEHENPLGQSVLCAQVLLQNFAPVPGSRHLLPGPHSLSARQRSQKCFGAVEPASWPVTPVVPVDPVVPVFPVEPVVPVLPVAVPVTQLPP